MMGLLFMVPSVAGLPFVGTGLRAFRFPDTSIPCGRWTRRSSLRIGEGVRRAASAAGGAQSVAQQARRCIGYEAARSAHLWGLGCLQLFVRWHACPGELLASGPYVNVPGVGVSMGLRSSAYG